MDVPLPHLHEIVKFCENLKLEDNVRKRPFTNKVTPANLCRSTASMQKYKDYLTITNKYTDYLILILFSVTESDKFVNNEDDLFLCNGKKSQHTIQQRAYVTGKQPILKVIPDTTVILRSCKGAPPYISESIAAINPHTRNKTKENSHPYTPVLDKK